MSKPLKHPKSSVMIAYPHPDHVDARFHASMMALMMYDAHTTGNVTDRGGYIAAESGPRIAAIRNHIVERFLAHECQAEWLFMIDTDMVFQPDVAERMLESAHPKDRPIVGGLCFAGGYGALMKVTMYVHEDNPDGTFNMRQAEEFPRDALVPVDATGAACLLVHRDALCAIGDAFRPHTSLPWFAETEKDGQPIGEDITFCLRARQLGIPIVVNTGVEVKHRKMGVLDLEAWDDYRSRLATFDGDVQAMAADYYSKV